MAFDQDINYRVRIDDADFQAKLSQMRASVDTMMGSSFGGFGGMGGYPMSAMMGNLGMMYMPGTAAMGGLAGGFADFGLQVRPITYTPPAIAMQPHFGMFQIQQTLGQAINNAFQPLTPFGNIPNNISAAEFQAYSARQTGNRLGDVAATGMLTAANFALGTVGSVAGAYIGTGLGGAIGGIAGGIFGGLAVGAVGEQISTQVAQNVAIQNALEAGSFRFLTGGPDVDPITGRGFGRGARRQIAGDIQRMEMRDVRYGMEEYGQILEAGMQMDMFSGTRDAEDFQKRFKDLVETVKVVSSTLHTSMKEGIEAIRGMRDIGVDTPGGMMQLTLRSEMLGRMAGRTGMEMMAVGQAGAEMFRGTGIRMGLGFESVQQNVVDVRNMLNQGTISRETVAQAGGELGLAQQMTATALGGLQSAYGRAFLMAGYDPSTGGFREGFLQGMGGRDIMSMATDATALAAGGPANLLRFQAHQHQLISKLSPEALEAMDMGMVMSGARIFSQFGLGAEDAFMAMGLQMGKPVEVLEAYMGKMKTDPAQLRMNMESAQAGMARQAMQEDFRNKYGIKAIGNLFRRALQPIADVAIDLRSSVASTFENIAVRATGGFVSDMTATPQTIREGEALLRGGAAAGTLVDLSTSSISPLRLSGASGETLAKQAEAAGLQTFQFKSRAEAEAEFRKRGEAAYILESSVGGAVTVTGAGDYTKFLQAAGRREATTEERALGERAFKNLGADVHESLYQLRQKQIAGGKVTLQDVISAGIRMKGVEHVTAADLGGTAMTVLEKEVQMYGFTGIDVGSLRDQRSAMLAGGMALEEAKKSLQAARTSIIRSGGLLEAFGAEKLSAEDIRDIGVLVQATPEAREGIVKGFYQTYGAEKAEALRKYATSLSAGSAEERTRFLKARESSMALIALGAEVSETAAKGSTAQGVGGVISAISSDQQQVLVEMSNQLKRNMEIILAMQEQFNAMRAAGGAR